MNFLYVLLVSLSHGLQHQSYRAFFFADLHIDPYYGTPNASHVCLNINLISSWGTNGCCPPPHLFRSALDYAKTQESSPLFIAFLGDIVRWHEDTMPGTVTTCMELLKNVTEETRTAFPGVPIVHVMGNHDMIPEWSTEVCTPSRCMSDAMLGQYADALADVLPPEQANNGSTFRRGGYYALNVSTPSTPLTILCINVLFLTWYHYPDTSSEADPDGMFSWMESTLANVRARGAKAYILMHVCPINYQAESYYIWLSGYIARYVGITQTYGDVIEMQACGHDHRDGWRTFEAVLNPSHAPMFVVAPFMPDAFWPSFRLVELDPVTLALADYAQYATNLNAIPSEEQGPVWYLQYTFKAWFGLATATNNEMRQAAQNMLTDNVLWSKYVDNFNPGGSCTNASGCQRIMVCNMVFRVQSLYQACCAGALQPLDASSTVVAVPANDLCENAIAIHWGDSVTGLTMGATLDGLPSTCVASQLVAPAVWYVLDLPAGMANLTVSMCNTLVHWDSQLSVFRGSCSNWVCVMSNDDAGGACGTLSRAAVSAPPAGRYLIAVHGYNGATGGFTLTVSASPSPSGPANDLCANATLVGWNDTVNGTTVGATLDGLPSTCVASQLVAPAVWYVLDLPAGMANLTVSTCNSLIKWDSQLSVFRGDCSNWVCVMSNDDAGGACGILSRVAVSSPPAGRYYIAVHGYNGATGGFTLTVSATQPPSNGPANDLCANAALVGWNVTVNGTTVGATLDGLPSTCVASQLVAPAVWYVLDLPAGMANLAVSTCDSLVKWDSQLSVFRGDCSNWVCVMSNDDVGGACGILSRVAILAPPVGRYYIAVHGYNGATGPFTLTVSAVNGTVPANDLCVNATTMGWNDTVTGTTVGATLDGLPSTCVASQLVAPAVWYVLDLPAGMANLAVSTCNSPVMWDSQLSVFRGNCSDWVCVMSDDDAGGTCNILSWATVNAPPAGRYYIAVHGYNGATGPFTLTTASNPR